MTSHMAKVALASSRHNAKKLPRVVGMHRCAARLSDNSLCANIIISRPVATSTSKVSCTIPTATSHIADQHHDSSNPLPQQAQHNEPLSSKKINFADSASAHGSKTTFELVRAIAVFRTCQLPFFIKHAESLLNISTKILGSNITNGLVKHTFFNHFCAGEDSLDMRPVIDMLQRNNIGPILDYAAESEGGEDNNVIADSVEGECVAILVF